MFEPIAMSIAVVGSFIAGLWDLKTTNIPDEICVFMIVMGIGLHAIESYFLSTYVPLLYSFIGGGAFLVFGLLMYYFGQWGGGDGELLVAIGFLLPVASVKTAFPFSLSFFINLTFVGAIYSIVYSIGLSIRDPQIVKNFKTTLKKDLLLLISIIFISLLAFFAFIVMNLTPFSYVPILIPLLFIFYKYAKSIEKGFYVRIPVSKLKVDDMIGEDIPKLKLYKKYIRGLTVEEVRKIKRLKRFVIIKDGIRYGLVFPLALIFTILFGDFFMFFI